MIPILALHALSEYYRLERKPPVTAGLLAANTLAYLRPGALDSILPPIDRVWFNPHLILKVRVPPSPPFDPWCYMARSVVVLLSAQCVVRRDERELVSCFGCD